MNLYRLRGKFQLYVFLLEFRWEYVVSFLGFLLGILILIYEPPMSIWSLILTIVSILIGVILLIRDWINIKRTEKDFYEVSSNRLNFLKNTSNYDEYEKIKFRECYAIYSSEVNRLLANMNLECEFKNENFEINQVAKSIAPFVLQTTFKSGHVFFNSSKIRLVSDLTPTEVLLGKRVVLQQTDYFSSICTNEMTCKEVWSRSTNTQIFDGLSFMSNNQFLLDLSESKCSNHIGVSTLAFTSDGKMVVTVQSAESAQSARRLAPSGSGSADREDLGQESSTFQSFIARAMKRELLEECGLINDNSDDLVKTHLIGFARLLHRGGKPEFFGVSFLNVPFNSLQITNKESVFIANIMEIRVNRTKILELKSALNRFRRKHQSTFSFLLYLHLIFLIEYVESSPDDLLTLLRPQSS